MNLCPVEHVTNEGDELRGDFAGVGLQWEVPCVVEVSLKSGHVLVVGDYLGDVEERGFGNL